MDGVLNCPHAKPLDFDAVQCGLGLYGGRPSLGTCLACAERGENNEQFAAALFARAEKAHPAHRPRVSGCCDRADQA